MSQSFIKSRARRRMIVVGTAASVVISLYFFTGLGQLLSFENFQRNREQIQRFVEGHYAASVASFIAAYVSTALFVPGALLLTIAGGFLFGAFLGSIFVLVGALTGALLAFYLARFAIGGWIQQHYGAELHRFNRELEKHGTNYLIILRLVPLFPFFLINYFAGMTRVSTRTYIISTFIGMAPGIVIYAFAGQNLRHFQSLGDVISPRMTALLILLAALALLPVVLRHLKK